MYFFCKGFNGDDGAFLFYFRNHAVLFGGAVFILWESCGSVRCGLVRCCFSPSPFGSVRIMFSENRAVRITFPENRTVWIMFSENRTVRIMFPENRTVRCGTLRLSVEQLFPTACG